MTMRLSTSQSTAHGELWIGGRGIGTARQKFIGQVVAAAMRKTPWGCPDAADESERCLASLSSLVHLDDGELTPTSELTISPG